MTVETVSRFATVIQEHLELKRRNAALEHEMPLEKYMPDDPFQNHPLFKTEEQARVEDTMDGAESDGSRSPATPALRESPDGATEPAHQISHLARHDSASLGSLAASPASAAPADPSGGAHARAAPRRRRLPLRTLAASQLERQHRAGHRSCSIRCAVG